MSAPEHVGFVGLGQMGGPMAANIATGGPLAANTTKSGFQMTAYDKAGTAGRAPQGAGAADSLVDVAGAADSIFLSLPDGPASLSVVGELAALSGRRAAVIIDLSTIGPGAARAAAKIAQDAGMVYIDAPVSGGQAGAIAATISLMWAGPEAEMERHRAILDAFCGNPFHVGDAPGQGQALKILNNFLSGTAMAATTEAILYGMSEGLEIKTMLDVINVSSGQNTASRDKFPARVLTGTFDAGFKTALLAKDIRLFLDNVRAAGSPDRVGSLVSQIWDECDMALPDSDFTRVFEFIQGRGKA